MEIMGGREEKGRERKGKERKGKERKTYSAALLGGDGIHDHGHVAAAAEPGCLFWWVC
jgi:hypothetical protein